MKYENVRINANLKKERFCMVCGHFCYCSLLTFPILSLNYFYKTLIRTIGCVFLASHLVSLS